MRIETKEVKLFGRKWSDQAPAHRKVKPLSKAIDLTAPKISSCFRLREQLTKSLCNRDMINFYISMMCFGGLRGCS